MYHIVVLRSLKSIIGRIFIHCITFCLLFTLNASTVPIGSNFRQLQEFSKKCRKDLDIMRKHQTNDNPFEKILNEADNLLIEVELSLQEDFTNHEHEDMSSDSHYQKLWDQLNNMQKLLEDAKNCKNNDRSLCLTLDKTKATNLNAVVPPSSNTHTPIPRYDVKEQSFRDLKDNGIVINYIDQEKEKTEISP